jgi:hypothetical protein
MPEDDGLVADVQSRARGALYNWNRPFNDQSVAYYRVESRARHPLPADIRDVSYYRKRQLDRAGQTLKKLAASAADVDPVALGWGGKLRCVAGREAAPVFLARRRQATVCSANLI